MYEIHDVACHFEPYTDSYQTEFVCNEVFTLYGSVYFVQQFLMVQIKLNTAGSERILYLYLACNCFV